MTQEAIRMRAGEDDRMDVRIAVCAINQFFQLFGDRGIKQRMRAAVDTSDKHPGMALNGNVSCRLRVHFTPSLSLVQSRWSAAEELDGDRGELVVELEDAAVPGVGVDDQLGALDATVQVLGERRGHHPVVVAVGDKGGRGDLRQIVWRAASPLLDRLQLRPERLHLDRSVTRSEERRVGKSVDLGGRRIIKKKKKKK